MNHVDPGYLAILVVVTVGAIARLTRLVTGDSITQPARAWINRHAKRANRRAWTWFDDLINCPWCVSIWISVPTAVIVMWNHSNRLVFAALVALSASWIAANVQMREPE